MTPRTPRSYEIFPRYARKDLIRTVRIDERCTACGQCIVTCPERALIRQPKRPGVLDDRCTGCLACVEICPVDAISEVAVA